MKIWKEGMKVEYSGSGTKVVFVCPNGHRTMKDYSKGPIPKRVGEHGVQLLAKYWNDRVTNVCNKC